MTRGPNGLEAVKHYQIKKGDRPETFGLPPQRIATARYPKSVAILGSDVSGLHPRFEVSEGEHVVAGQVVLRDRKQPQIAFVSPVSGVVSEMS